MSDTEAPIPTNRGIVSLSDASKDRLRRQLLVGKADKRIPDEVWLILQECGEAAAEHLRRILLSPAFEKRKIHEQIRVIELALLRSYGAPEGSFKRAPEEAETDQKAIDRGDHIRRLAQRARFPELNTGNRSKSPKPGL